MLLPLMEFAEDLLGIFYRNFSEMQSCCWFGDDTNHNITWTDASAPQCGISRITTKLNYEKKI